MVFQSKIFQNQVDQKTWFWSKLLVARPMAKMVDQMVLNCAGSIIWSINHINGFGRPKGLWKKLVEFQSTQRWIGHSNVVKPKRAKFLVRLSILPFSRSTGLLLLQQLYNGQFSFSSSTSQICIQTFWNEGLILKIIFED